MPPPPPVPGTSCTAPPTGPWGASGWALAGGDVNTGACGGSTAGRATHLLTVGGEQSMQPEDCRSPQVHWNYPVETGTVFGCMGCSSCHCRGRAAPFPFSGGQRGVGGDRMHLLDSKTPNPEKVAKCSNTNRNDPCDLSSVMGIGVVRPGQKSPPRIRDRLEPLCGEARKGFSRGDHTGYRRWRMFRRTIAFGGVCGHGLV